MEKISEQEVRRAILRKFDKLRDCAEALNIKESSLNSGIRNRSTRFLIKLEKLGIKLITDTEMLREVERLQEENIKLKAKLYDLQNSKK